MLRIRDLLVGKPSIMRNLTWGLVLTVTVVLVLFNVFFYWRSANQIQRDLDSRATDIADRLSGVLGAPLWNFDARTIEQSAEVYSDLEEVVYLRIQSDLGDVVYENKKDAPGIGSIDRTEDVVYEDRVVGQVEISISRESIAQAQRDSLVSTVLSTLGIVIAIVVTSQLLLRRFLNQPLTELTRGLDQIAQGKYQHRLTPFNLVDMDTIAQGVNVMASQIAERDRQLHGLVNTLEDRVSERTRDLKVAAVVSRQVTSELTLDALLTHVAKLTQQAFDLYQVHVFLLNEAEHTLELKAAAGAVGANVIGQRMGIRLNERPGLIAAAGREQEVRVSNDVLNDDLYLPINGLPDTRSEAALPILFAGGLLGVLDLQSKELKRFSPSDLDVLQTLAEQIAIAVRNANLYEGAVEARERAERADMVKSQF
ncbi:MAG: GAF domain-containing protein, partial [Anaerolineae bacterium]|nr:GAF domain-containing protein [Anaerolineae bacterium]